MKEFLVTKRNVTRQHPRLLYAGANNNAIGWLSDIHKHDAPEFMLVKNGSGRIKIDNAEYPFKTGDLIIYDPETMHTEFFDETPNRELMFLSMGNIHLTGLEPNHILKDNNFSIIPTDTYFTTLTVYFEQLIMENEGRMAFHETISDHLTRVVFMYMLRLLSFDISLSFKQNNAYNEAKKYFDENFVRIGSLDNVCKSLYINKFYLTHIFKEQAGMPPIKYIIMKRLELARQYIENTDMNINEIAKACGYLDTGYFCRVFRTLLNITPLQYRFNYKQKQKDLHAKDKTTAKK